MVAVKLTISQRWEPRTKGHGSLSDEGRSDKVKEEYRTRVPSLPLLMTTAKCWSYTGVCRCALGTSRAALQMTVAPTVLGTCMQDLISMEFHSGNFQLGPSFYSTEASHDMWWGGGKVSSRNSCGPVLPDIIPTK